MTNPTPESRETTPMRPEDVPEEWAKEFARAWLAAADQWDASLLARHGLAAVYPAIERQVRAKVAQERADNLARIAEAHRQGTAEVGMVSGTCVECMWDCPCPTYLWATGQRDPALDTWEPEREGEQP